MAGRLGKSAFVVAAGAAGAGLGYLLDPERQARGRVALTEAAQQVRAAATRLPGTVRKVRQAPHPGGSAGAASSA